MAPNGCTSSQVSLKYAINHVFLTPKLPQSDDYEVQLEHELLDLAISALEDCGQGLDSDVLTYVHEAVDVLRKMQTVHPMGYVDKNELQKLLGRLLKDRSTLALHIRSQNAGVLIRGHSDGVHFDQFELLPENEAVLTCKGRLKRTFPATSVKISKSTYREDGLQSALAVTLANLSAHDIAGMQPKIRKAGQDHDELRDPTHPGMISEVFNEFLMALGKPESAPLISKCTREEVLWDKTKLPWHRSALWLLIRVALQMHSVRTTGSDTAYKTVMAIVMGSLLNKAVLADMESEDLHIMIAKLNRRLRKLGLPHQSALHRKIEPIMVQASEALALRWSSIQANDVKDLQLSRLKDLDFTKDTILKLDKLDSYLDSKSKEVVTKHTHDIELPQCEITFPPEGLPCLDALSTGSERTHLLAVESWVEHHLQRWIKLHAKTSSTCNRLRELLQTYHAQALKAYRDRPLDLSVMLLTVAEIWVACDKMAVSVHQQLGLYNPGVFLPAFENLLLPFKSQTDRLHLAEQYIAGRRSSARFSPELLFVHAKDPQSFAAQYFNDSSALQEVHQEILDEAQREREEKKAELKQLKQQYEQLLKQSAERSCDYYSVCVDRFNDFWEERHSRKCQKCRLRDQAQAIKIDIHEWPLPEDATLAKSIVFELRVPPVFQQWRKATQFFILNVLGAKHGASSSNGQYTSELYKDPHVKAFAGTKDWSISLASTTKAHVITHRNAKPVATATERDICLKNGLSYKYYDAARSVFISTFTWNDDMAKKCTLKVPGQAALLQQSITRPQRGPDGPQPNVVIARQGETPDHMSIEEFRDLAMVPLGRKLQWFNIASQLQAPTIDFKKSETAVVLLQCIYQTGPPQDRFLGTRSSHVAVTDEAHASIVLNALVIESNRIRKNWESATALHTLSSIACRVLSLTSSTKIAKRCYAFLSDLSSIADGWIQRLREKADDAQGDGERMAINDKLHEIALICALVFDVDKEHMQALLNQEGTAARLLFCYILIHEGRQTSGSGDTVFSLMQSRFQRLTARLIPSLRTHHEGLDEAIRRYWPAYQPSSSWTDVSTSDQWLMTVTKSQSAQTMQIHYNIANGALLVDGLPLGRPPQDYESATKWSTFFGNSALEVLPVSAAGMEFITKRQFNGFDVQFGLESGSRDLRVRASKGSVVYETVPSSCFQGHFPRAFVNEFAHWYNKSTATVEFRPIDDLWNHSSREIWYLSKHGNGWQMTKGESALFGLKSKSASSFARILAPLATATQIHATLQTSSEGVVLIDIPAINLGFSLSKGETSLISREYRGFSVAGEQRLDALIGFRNKLILKQEAGDDSCVLLPEAPIQFSSSSGHVTVQVDLERISTVHRVKVNRQLRSLEDNGSLQSKLYLAYAHALTSFCMPDPLTGYTGTESALKILKSGAVRSFDHLCQAHLDVLGKLEKMTPQRSFYPKSERVMQNISWNLNLSSLSQHEDFHSVVESLLQQDDQSMIFAMESDNPRRPPLTPSDEILLQRASIRMSTFRVSEFGAEAYTRQYDTIYKGRDGNQKSERGANAFRISSMIHNGSGAREWKGSAQLWTRCAQTVSVLQGSDVAIDPSLFTDFASAVNNGVPFRLWPALHRLLSRSQDHRPDKFVLMTWLSALTASEQRVCKPEVLQTLALCFTNRQLAKVRGPEVSDCSPVNGYAVTLNDIEQIVQCSCLTLEETPEGSLAKLDGELWNNFKSRRNAQFRVRQSAAVENLAESVFKQWPCAIPVVSDLSVRGVKTSDYIKTGQAFAAITQNFKTWYDNLLFFQYFQRLEQAIDSLPLQQTQRLTKPRCEVGTTLRNSGYISSSALFEVSAPLQFDEAAPKLAGGVADVQILSSSAQECPRLSLLIRDLKQMSHGSQFEDRYTEKLQASLVSLQQQRPESSLVSESALSATALSGIAQYHEQASAHAAKIYHFLVAAVGPSEKRKTNKTLHSTAEEVFQWPRISPSLFLNQLNYSNWRRLSIEWKGAIVQYGLALAAERRASRLCNAAISRNLNGLIKELANEGHVNWDPLLHPEWLLLEVESGITIRDVQAQIAFEMMDPRSKMNTVMQLNMGEGKSSVIVPMAAAALANGEQLIRVVVAKPHSKQMSDMLITKLGGLLGRRICFLPFSRGVKLTRQHAETIERIVLNCKSRGDVLLVQPEHLLSLQLMSLETYNSGKEEIGDILIRVLDFFNSAARTIVDESDENFSVKFEVVYTMGTQKPIDCSPDRWIHIQNILDIVCMVALEVKELHPDGIELLHYRPGAFPKIRLLQEEAEKELLVQVAESICQFGLEHFPIARQSQNIRNSVLRYITENQLSKAEINAVEKSGFWIESTKDVLLLLRGLLAEGVLGFVLRQKRWRVNYGLAPKRAPETNLAVPYHAKDAPTARSEFSHPEVIICLTSLSYYYGGLKDDELFAALTNLVDQDSRDIEYADWVRRASGMPSHFLHLDGVNLKDTTQCVSELFPFLRYNKGTIDYYLSRLIFPKEMKEFPSKLSASGWDLGAKTRRLTTGFSGTSDSSAVLPLDMDYVDLPAQSHTNALVMKHLLGSENSVIMMPPQTLSSASDADRLLQTVINLETRIEVILDVGAQILELDNLGVARRWLELDSTPGKKAVVFVNERDDLSVLDRKGKIESLQTSPFSSQLDLCFVFLDEAHTRGIDLQLPDDYRAVVTLGPNLTKDRLVQACMRMRKLGKGQAITFCLNDEIRGKIVSCLPNARETSDVDVADVLCWSISETFKDMRRSMPLWAMQGGRFLRQQDLWDEVCRNGKTSMAKDHAHKFLEPEAQSLDQRYRPVLAQDGMEILNSTDTVSSTRLSEIRDRCGQFDQLEFRASTLQEEQERELSPEIEQERQVERPAKASPAPHSIHNDMRALIIDGKIKSESTGYMPAFQCLKDSSAAKYLVRQLLCSDKLLVSTDFATTVKERGVKKFISDQFHRPVQWVLAVHDGTKGAVTHLLIISPFEASVLLSPIEISRRVTLRLYKPRCNASYPCSFDDLCFLTIPQCSKVPDTPQSLKTLLNLFAGQLYFKSFDDYLKTCDLLGLATSVPKGAEEVDADGFIARREDGSKVPGRSPVKGLQILNSKIRKCDQSIAKTHVGSMLEGNLLTEADFDEEREDAAGENESSSFETMMGLFRNTRVSRIMGFN